MGEPLPLFIGVFGGGGYRRMRRQEIEAYLKRFQVFEAAVGREFPARHGARAMVLRRSWRQGLRRLRRCVGWPQRPAGQGINTERTE